MSHSRVGINQFSHVEIQARDSSEASTNTKKWRHVHFPRMHWQC